MSEGEDQDRVGYRKPPAQHRFEKGKSGNPKGRPKKQAKNQASATPATPKGLDFGTQPANQMLIEEAYRTVTVREGEQAIELPAIKAVFRAMGVAAIKGNRFAQRTLADLVRGVEEEDRKLRSEHMQAAIDYKVDWQNAIADAQRHGREVPEPLPHPDDIIIDLKLAKVTYAGPMTPEEKREWDRLTHRRDGAQQEVSYYAERHRRTRDPERKAQWLEEWHAEQKLFDIINDNLPPRYRKELADRSWATGASRAGSQTRNQWRE